MYWKKTAHHKWIRCHFFILMNCWTEFAVTVIFKVHYKHRIRCLLMCLHSEDLIYVFYIKPLLNYLQSCVFIQIFHLCPEAQMIHYLPLFFPPQTLHNFINLYQATLRALKASIMYISSQIQTFNLRCFHILLNRVELISVLKPGCVWKSCVSYIMWFLYLVFLLLPLLKTLCVFQVLQVGEQVRKALLDGLPFLPKRTTQHQRM